MGLPRVIAMQAPVTDHYATELAAAFYRQLSVPAFPRAGVALARARQALAHQDGDDAAARPSTEWATATLTATEDGPLIDSDLDLAPLRQRPVHLATDVVSALPLGELIGRRVELRETLRALRGEHSDSSSVVLTGIGGVGKSSIAGRVMARLTETGWVCSVITGTWSLEALCAALLVDLPAADHTWARALGEQLADLPADDRARLRFLERMLRLHPVLLVLDNFEDNLTPDGGGFAEEGTSTVIERLAESCATGKLLVTCRYPPPGLPGLFRQVSIGPLSSSETRRLFLRLTGLRSLPEKDAALVHRLVGEHPRVLEFLDALLRCGVSTDRVRRTFHELADTHEVDVTQDRELREHVAVAVQLGARDICLEVLLATLDDAEREVLLQTAVSSVPVEVSDLATSLADSGFDATVITRAAQRLADLSSVVRSDQELWVHRWTAEGLRESQPPDDYRRRCQRAGELRLRRLAEARRDVAEGIEATQNFLDTEEWDQAAEVASFLAQSSNLQRLSFTAHVLATLPLDHHAYSLFVDHEGSALVALGLTDEAVERYHHLVDTFTQRARAEPGRADYQRDLSVSYQRLGMCLVLLGRAEDAAAAFECHLQLALDVHQRLGVVVGSPRGISSLGSHGTERDSLPSFRSHPIQENARIHAQWVKRSGFRWTNLSHQILNLLNARSRLNFLRAHRIR
ncbi:MAG: ATP-binding protein [Pseudonocardiaceae bacterium]